MKIFKSDLLKKCITYQLAWSFLVCAYTHVSLKEAAICMLPSLEGPSWADVLKCQSYPSLLVAVKAHI